MKVANMIYRNLPDTIFLLNWYQTTAVFVAKKRFSDQKEFQHVNRTSPRCPWLYGRPENAIEIPKTITRAKQLLSIPGVTGYFYDEIWTNSSTAISSTTCRSVVRASTMNLYTPFKESLWYRYSQHYQPCYRETTDCIFSPATLPHRLCHLSSVPKPSTLDSHKSETLTDLRCR